MLLQSRPNVIKLLPELPAMWPEGKFRGWNTRVCVQIDLKWSEQGRMWSAKLTATRDITFTLIPPPGSISPQQSIPLSCGQFSTVAALSTI